jgi:hypothetical protein
MAFGWIGSITGSVTSSENCKHPNRNEPDRQHCPLQTLNTGVTWAVGIITLIKQAQDADILAVFGEAPVTGSPEITNAVQMTLSRSLESGSRITLILADGSVMFGLVADPIPECARKLAKNRRCKSPTGKV